MRHLSKENQPWAVSAPPIFIALIGMISRRTDFQNNSEKYFFRTLTGGADIRVEVFS